MKIASPFSFGAPDMARIHMRCKSSQGRGERNL